MRDLLTLKDWTQKQGAKKLGISESLMSYWCHNNSAVAPYLGQLIKVFKPKPKDMVELLIKHLS